MYLFVSYKSVYVLYIDNTQCPKANNN